MRNLLFRGKRTDNGEWICSGNIIHFEDENLVFIPQKHDKCGTTHDEYDNILSIQYGTFYKVNPATVGQFTGLIDLAVIRAARCGRCCPLPHLTWRQTRPSTWSGARLLVISMTIPKE